MTEICQGCQDQIERGFNYVEGEGCAPARYLLVGEAPGATEDEKGRPFIGESGQILRRALRELGVWDFYITNSVRVRPGHGNPDPNMGWIRQCRETCMRQTLDLVEPDVIVGFGRHALRSFTDNGNIPLTANRHKTFWFEHNGRRIPFVATWHPSYINREPNAYGWWMSDLEAYFLHNSWDRQMLDTTYRVVSELTPAARRSSAFTVDVETTGLHPWNGQRLRMSGIRPAGSVTNIVVANGGRDELRRLAMDPEVELTGHHLAFDLLWAIEPQEIPRCKVRDTLYHHYLLDERYPIRGLKHLARLYTPYEPIDLPRGGIDFPDEEVQPYCADDVALTDLVWNGIETELVDNGVNYGKCAELYGRAIPILAGMTRTGIPVDTEVLAQVRESEERKVHDALEHVARIWEANRPLEAGDCEECLGSGTCESTEKEEASVECVVCSGMGYLWYEVAWDPSVLNRSHDLSDFIYKTLGCPIPRIKGAKRKDGRGSTSRDILETLVADGYDGTGFIQALFAYRDVNDNVRKYVLDVERRVALDGRLRPQFNIVTRLDHGDREGTTSGRMSVSKPGLHSTPTGHPMRRSFVPLPDHTHLVQVDRSQAELTDLAQVTRDENLTNLINDRIDQHQRMADLATEAGYPMARPEAKTVNFGILYGIGPNGLEQRTRFDAEAGRKFIDLWFREYPQVRKYMQEIHYLALRRGYVETPYGRRRNFPLGLNARTSEGGKAQRQAFNFIIQATANDLNMLFLKEWCDHVLHDLAFPIFVIHDAVLFSTADPQGTLEAIADGYRTWYPDAVEEFLDMDLNVVMRADAKVGPNWGEAVGKDENDESMYWFSTDPAEGRIDEIT